MNTLNLESFVDSSSIFYLAEAVGLMAFQKGLLCAEDFRCSAFVSLKAYNNSDLKAYPLYSGGSKEVRN